MICVCSVCAGTCVEMHMQSLTNMCMCLAKQHSLPMYWEHKVEKDLFLNSVLKGRLMTPSIQKSMLIALLEVYADYYRMIKSDQKLGKA